MKRSIIIGVFVSVLLTTCFSQWQGDEATLTISLLGQARAATGFNDKVDSAELAYTITLTNNQSGEVRNAVINAAGTHATAADLAPGFWDILVETTFFGYPYAQGAISTFTVSPGSNSASVPMHRLSNAIALNIADGASYFFLSIKVEDWSAPPLEIKIWNFTDKDTVEMEVETEFKFADEDGYSEGFHSELPQPEEIEQDDCFTFWIYPRVDKEGYFSDTLTIKVNGNPVAGIDLYLTVTE